MDPALLERVLTWLAQDPDADTRAELQHLLDTGDVTEIMARFSGTLAFGTAGLRAELGAGPMRMNRVVVARAAAGLAAHLMETFDSPSIVIGHDARDRSDIFARDTAEIMQGAGVRAILLPLPLPTPVLAHAIGRLGSSAGVMVTASHNPPLDNGYKVYLGDTSQIVSPVDGQIAARIDAVGSIGALPRNNGYEERGDEARAAYLEDVTGRIPEGPRAVSVAYTPLHGVGGSVFADAAHVCGFTEVHGVPEQFDPDPLFPTVAFPNPEEPGAMDAALALAHRLDTDLVLAHDPDADRLAVGVREGAGHRMLTGDELGSILAQIVLRNGVTGTFANSIVSSRLLGRIAAAHGQPWTQTLTGFKWIGKVKDLAYGYEEALGYCVMPDLIRDKDGISAALILLAHAAHLRAADRTLFDVLDDLYREHGVHATAQVSVRSEDPGVISQMMAGLRSAPPTDLAGSAVTVMEDLSTGSANLPPTDAIRMTMANGARITFRPSGTESKLKCYLEVVVDVSDDLASARRDAEESLAALKAHLTQLLTSLGRQ